MGTFRHSMTLISPDGQRREELQAQVDTGATFSSAPAEVLERLDLNIKWLAHNRKDLAKWFEGK